MNSTMAWFLLFALGVLLIIAGFQGSLGRILAVAFIPGDLDIYESSGWVAANAPVGTF